MEYIEAKQIVLDSIRKVIPQEVEIPENENLLVHMGPLDLIYVVSFIEEKSNVDLSERFGKSPEYLTIEKITNFCYKSQLCVL